MADGEISPKSPSLHSDATRILTAIDKRIERRLKDGARISSTWGTVGEVDAGVHEASAYLYGETDGAYMSGGFRIPETQYLTVGDVVKVNINYDTDERWVEEVNVPAAYKPLLVDSVRASVAFGPGTAAASSYIRWDSPYAAVVMDEGDYGDANAWNVLGELRIYRASGANYVLLTDPTNLNASSVAFAMKNTGEMQWGPSGSTRDVRLYRNGANQMYMEAAGGANTNNPLFRLLSDSSPGSTDYTAFAANRAGDVAARWVGGYMGDKEAVGIGLGSGSTSRDVFIYRSSDSRLRIQAASTDTFGSGDYAAFRWLDSSQNAKWLMDYGTTTSNDLRILYATGTTPSESAVEVSRWTYNDGAGPRILLGRSNSRVGFDSTISPTALSANTNNWNPTNLDLANTIKISTDSTVRTITGIVAPPNHGIFLWLFNVNTATDIILAHESASSTAANRFLCPGNADLTLAPRGGVEAVYDGTSQRWRILLPQANTSWTAPTLTNSWVNYGNGFQTASYMKDAAGFVHLRGLIKNGTAAAAAFTLPSGFRPAMTLIYSVYSNAAPGRVDIETSGQVIPEAGGTGYVPLDGIIFWPDGS